MSTHGNHKPRKRFGQNFLVDGSIVERIINAINPAPEDAMVEIGPGQGALTRHLLASGVDLHVIEIDRDLAAALPTMVPGLKPENIHVGDALKMDPTSVVPTRAGQKLRVVGNLPYNISTPLLAHLLDFTEGLQDMHFMLQKEVVDRITAAPGSKAYGRLTLLCQYYCAAIPLFPVPPEAFSPAPRVDSAFFRLTPHPAPPVEVQDHALFQQVVAQAFSKRRKTLRNSLAPMMNAEMIAEAGIDASLRAEALSMEDYAALTAVVAHYQQ